MAEPISNEDDNDTGSEEVVNESDEADPIVTDFHAKNRQRKGQILRSLAAGAAFGTGKEVAEKVVHQFIDWLQN